jgi:hypothetical protein
MQQICEGSAVPFVFGKYIMMGEVARICAVLEDNILRRFPVPPHEMSQIVCTLAEHMMQACEHLCARAETDVQTHITWDASQRKAVYTEELRGVVVEQIWRVFDKVARGGEADAPFQTLAGLMLFSWEEQTRACSSPVLGQRREATGYAREADAPVRDAGHSHRIPVGFDAGLLQTVHSCARRVQRREYSQDKTTAGTSTLFSLGSLEVLSPDIHPVFASGGRRDAVRSARVQRQMRALVAEIVYTHGEAGFQARCKLMIQKMTGLCSGMHEMTVFRAEEIGHLQQTIGFLFPGMSVSRLGHNVQQHEAALTGIHLLHHREPVCSAHSPPLCKVPGEIWTVCKDADSLLYNRTRPSDGRFSVIAALRVDILVHLLHFLV